MNDEPEALRLADMFERSSHGYKSTPEFRVAAELRRQHAEIERLSKALGECSGGYQTLEKEVLAFKAENESFCMAYRMKADEETKQLHGEVERLKADAEIGRKWRKNSSLAMWFPYTAAELTKLKAEVEALRKDMQREHVDHAQTVTDAALLAKECEALKARTAGRTLMRSSNYYFLGKAFTDETWRLDRPMAARPGEKHG